MNKPEPANAPIRMRGEALRTKSSPTISELMARRALEVPAEDPNSYDLSAGCEMGLTLGAWDIKAAGPVVKTLSKRCVTVMRYSGPQMGSWIAKLALARAQTGDTNAFDDYAAWLPTTTPDQFGNSISDMLKPVEEYPANALLQQAAAKIFSDTNSSWSRLPWQNNGMENPAASGLVSSSAFRELLVRELDRKEICDSVSWQRSGMLNYSMSNQRGSFMYPLSEALHTTNGTSAELRWCDWIALAISNGKHSPLPPYNPFAPVAKRDEALSKFKAWRRKINPPNSAGLPERNSWNRPRD
jgi:hypothetical protein